MIRLFCLFFLFVISACEKEVITVEVFKKDPALIDSYFSKCKNGELHREDIICLNVRKAKKEITLDMELELLSNGK